MRKPAISVGLMVLAPVALWAQCQVIDDFTSGPVRLGLRIPNTSVAKTQTGSMLGGVRGTAFLIGGNQFLQPAEIDIDNGGPLVMTTGLREFFRLDMVYGVNASFVFTPLGYHPTGCDRFRVTFDSASRVLNFNILAFQGPGITPFQDGINLDPGPFLSPFCVDFLFSNFITGAPNTPEDFAGQGLNALDFIFQSGSAIGANEFAITKIETVDPITAGANPCAIVAPHL